MAEIDTRNRRSIALAQGLGFVKVALTIGVEMIDGHLNDELRFELRANDSQMPNWRV